MHIKRVQHCISNARWKYVCGYDTTLLCNLEKRHIKHTTETNVPELRAVRDAAKHTVGAGIQFELLLQHFIFFQRPSTAGGTLRQTGLLLRQLLGSGGGLLRGWLGAVNGNLSVIVSKKKKYK